MENQVLADILETWRNICGNTGNIGDMEKHLWKYRKYWRRGEIFVEIQEILETCRNICGNTGNIGHMEKHWENIGNIGDMEKHLWKYRKYWRRGETFVEIQEILERWGNGC